MHEQYFNDVSYDDDVYLRLQHGKRFHNRLYVLHKTQKPSL
jgi:hypothetical protein